MVKVTTPSPHLTIISPTTETLVRRVETQSIQVGQAQTSVQRLTQVYGQIAMRADDLGWRFFQDSVYTAANPLFLPANVKTQIPDDGQGILTNAFGTPSTQWLNPTTARLYPDHLGDVFQYRFNFTVLPTVNNKSLLFSFEIGTANPVYNERESITTGAGIPTPLSKLVVSGSSASALNNGGAAYLTSEADCYIYKISILAQKTYAVPR